MRRVVDATRKDEVVRSQSGLLDPLLDSVASYWCDLELNRTLGLVLHNDGPSCHLVTVADVPHSEANEVAAAQLAVDPQIEEGELARPAFHLKAYAKCPDVLDLERRLLADDLPCSMTRDDQR